MSTILAPRNLMGSFSSVYLLALSVLVLVLFTVHVGSPSVHPPPSLDELEWWQQAVIYQIYPRSFQDTNGDGIGDLKGIQSRLDYLVDLGIGAVWLSPFYTSPMVDFGYDISNFTDVDPTFGTLGHFQELVNAMHQRNIKVIIDLIPNHSSDKHPWFLKSVARQDPYTDFYTWRDPKYDDTSGNRLPPNNWVSMFGGSMWEWSEQRGQYYLHQYAKEQPDLRMDNPQVMKAVLDVMDFWIEKGVDGFRMDAVPRLFEDQSFPDERPSQTAMPGTPPDAYHYWEHRHTFNKPQVLACLAEFRKLLDNKSVADGKRRVMMTEGYIHSLPDLMKYYGTLEQPIAHFPFNFKLAGLQAFQASAVKQVVDEWIVAARMQHPAAWPNWLVGNHDKSRVADRFGPHLVDAVNTVVLLLPGTAVTYYGEELGMQNHAGISYENTKDVKGIRAGRDRYRNYSRDPERTPMQWDSTKNAGFSSSNTTWLPLNPNYGSLNVQAQNMEEDIESHLKVYKALVALRQTPEWQYGNLETQVIGDVFGFTRTNTSHGILVLVNPGSDLDSRKVTTKIDATTTFEGVPCQGTVFVRSVGFMSEEVKVGSSLYLDSVELEVNTCLVLRYVRRYEGTKENCRNMEQIVFGWNYPVIWIILAVAAAAACVLVMIRMIVRHSNGDNLQKKK